jgi:hypothetical protein
MAQPASSLLSTCIVFYIVVHELKQASLQNSGISLIAHVHLGDVLYQRTSFVGVYCHVLNGNQIGPAKKFANCEFLKQPNNLTF